MISDFDKSHVQEILQGHGTSFTANLLRLCAQADFQNLARIRLGFPDEVQAYLDWREGSE